MNNVTHLPPSGIDLGAAIATGFQHATSAYAMAERDGIPIKEVAQDVAEGLFMDLIDSNPLEARAELESFILRMLQFGGIGEA